MTDQQQILSHLSEVFKGHEASLNGRTGTALHRFQLEAFRKLQEVHFPDRKHEDWKYTPISKLISPGYLLAERSGVSSMSPISGLDSYVITIINGRWIPEETDPTLQAEGVELISLPDAFSLPGWEQAFPIMSEDQKPDPNHAFRYLNFSFHAGAFVIHIPDGISISKPIEVRIQHQGSAVSFSHPLFFVKAGKACQVTLFERIAHSAVESPSPPESLLNVMSFYHLDQQAQIQHIKWQDLPASHHLVYNLSAAQQRDSRFTTLAFDYGGACVRNTIEISLHEPNTFTSLKAGFVAKDKQSMDHQTIIRHQVPHGESHEHYKGIIDDQATAAFNGKVYVHPDAQKTNAYQQNDALVLSPNAVMNSKPQLEIFADDVRCSHGATIGQLDERALFYLKSRGITSEMAERMLKTAFLSVVLDEVQIEPIREHIASRLTVES